MREAVDHELVVVNAPPGAGEPTGLLWRPQRRDVPDVGYRIGVLSKFGNVDLIIFIIKDKIRLPTGVKDPALVGVGNSLVGGPGDNRDVGFVFNVITEKTQ